MRWSGGASFPRRLCVRKRSQRSGGAHAQTGQHPDGQRRRAHRQRRRHREDPRAGVVGGRQEGRAPAAGQGRLLRDRLAAACAAQFEFLRASSFKPAQTDAAGATVLPAGFRIKTVRLRGQVSQGICFPLSLLPPGAPTEEGADVTDLLAITKWEPPTPVGMSGKVKGGFPAFIAKTDETRVQVLEPVLARHRGKTFYVTEKLDGTSFSAFLREGTFGICSRNLWMDEADETNILVRVARRLKLEDGLRAVRERRGGGPAPPTRAHR